MSSPLATFKLGRYFAQHEFSSQYMLSYSDVESFTLQQILSMADDECRVLWDSLSLENTKSVGHPLLLKEIASMYPGLSTDHVLEVVPQEGIYIVMKVMSDLCKNGSIGDKPHAIVAFPALQSLHENLRANGCDVTLWRVTSGPQEWYFDLDDLQALLRPDTKLLVVNFPHNPTGYIPSEEDWKKLIAICKDRGIFLFSDEMFRLTNNDGTPPYPSACCLYDKAITLFGLTKAFGLAGLRMGWLCTQNEELMNAMKKMKDYLSISASAPTEILAIIALRNKEELLAKIQAIIQENLEILDEFFGEFPQLFCWRKPKACTTGFLELKSWLLEVGEGGAEGLCETLRDECGILLLPGSAYDYNEGYVRLGFGRKNLKEIIPIFRQFLLNHELKYQNISAQ